LSDHVAFEIAVGGWQGHAWKQDLMRVETELRANRFPDEDIKEAVAFAKQRMDLFLGNGPFEELDVVQEAVKDRPWFAHVHRCDRSLFESARGMCAHDTGPSWEGVHCPVLVIYGDRDESSGPPDPL